MDHSKKMSHEAIEATVDVLCDQGVKNPRMEVFGTDLEGADIMCRMYSGGHEKLYDAARLLFNEISNYSDPRDLLNLTVAELVSLYVDVNPGYMDHSKRAGLVPLDDRNLRDNEYRK